MAMLRQAGVTLLNQSVLLRGVNDNAQPWPTSAMRCLTPG
ncbi:KamA family protein [Klebsiella pneumoniae]|nr:KamA family protein [Klebsiella pneumoniae]